MAISKTEIGNLALIEIGESTIQDISDDTPTADVLRALYKPTLDWVLRDHVWNFARKRANLTSTGSVAEWSYDRGFNNEDEAIYNLPVDCLKAIELNGQDIHTNLWRVEGRTIVTSMSAPLQLLYTARIENEALFDAYFIKAFSKRLASEMVIRVTQDSQRKEQLEAEYARLIKDARSTDSQEGTPRQVTTSGWDLARWSGSGSYNWPYWWDVS